MAEMVGGRQRGRGYYKIQKSIGIKKYRERNRWEEIMGQKLGTVHPKMKILSSFTHPQVDPNLYECVCSEHKGRYSEERGKQSSIISPTMEVNGAPKQPDYKLSSKYLPLCSEQTHSYRFGST